MDIFEELDIKIENQRQFFASGVTIDAGYRVAALKRLQTAVWNNESLISEALKADLGKSNAEAYVTEIGMALSGLRYMISHTKKFAKKKRIRGSLLTAPSSQFILPEPYGRTLIIAPWNYPFLLCIDPLVGAIAAGNCVMLKPSKSAPATAAVVGKIISETFDPAYVTVIDSTEEVRDALLEKRFDYIFYTGSPRVGKTVMEKASKHLTPVTLELGGKSPCIIDKSADLQKSMKRIIFGKTLNSGQTCIAPDYLIVHNRHRNDLIMAFQRSVAEAWGEEPLKNPDYSFIVNDKHFERLCGYLDKCNILAGSKSDKADRKIEPTLVSADDLSQSIMQEEIFGPILPVVWFEDISEVIDFVCAKEKPLSLYLFSKNKRNINLILKKISFGGGCVNDTIMHLSSHRLPFGGVGNSGMGSYHGKASFDTFTHYKSILKKPFAFDNPMRYRPMTRFKELMIKKFLK